MKKRSFSALDSITVALIMAASAIVLYVILGFGRARDIDGQVSLSLADTSYSQIKNVTVTNIPSAITRGNHSYIPMNQHVDTSYQPAVVLAILEKFEKEHEKDLRITGWHLDVRDESTGYLYGIYVDHMAK